VLRFAAESRWPIGRRYALSKKIVFERFPHQFQPFLSLPLNVQDAVNSGTGFKGTILRVPLRR
jgi:hypothetical protein